MRKGFTKVVAAEKIRVGHCHGQHAGRGWTTRRKNAWRLWLDCGHVASRVSSKPPMSVKCASCETEKEYKLVHTRMWKKGDIPNEFGVERFK